MELFSLLNEKLLCLIAGKLISYEQGNKIWFCHIEIWKWNTKKSFLNSLIFSAIHIFWFNKKEVCLNKIDTTGMSINYYLKYGSWQAARKSMKFVEVLKIRRTVYECFSIFDINIHVVGFSFAPFQNFSTQFPDNSIPFKSIHQ